MVNTILSKVMNNVVSFLPLCLITFTPLQSFADYVDDINNTTGQRAAGRQVIYEMNIGAFTAEGTLAAAQQQLGHLKQVGVDIVWLMPIYPRGGGINSPYAATDFQQVNPSYGTIADLKAFVSAAHALDMQVWLDWVPNHTATNATWVTTHPDYYVQSGGQFVHPNNYGDVYQLNYSNPSLATAMTDCLKFWIDQADIDGYRCDYVSSSYIPTSYWQTAIPEVKSYKASRPNSGEVGEGFTFLGEADIAKDATRLKTAGFDYDYAWEFQSQLLSFGPGGNAAARPKAFVNTLIGYQSSINFGRMVYLTNHDQNYNESAKTLTQKYGDNRYPLTVLAFTVWGMPLIYNGQEIGGNQPLNYFTDEKINWSSVDAKMQNTIRTLAALKHSATALQDGKTTASSHTVNWLTVTNNSAVMAYTCKAPSLSGQVEDGSEVLVVINFGTSAATPTITGITAGQYGLWLDSQTISQGTSRKQVTLNATNTFNIEAKGYQVYVKGQFSEESLPSPEIYVPMLGSSDEMALFFETPDIADYRVWAWGNGQTEQQHLGISGDWSGRPAMTLMGAAANGSYIYKFVFQGNVAPTNFIITKNGDNPRPFDGTEYVVNGYYVEGIPAPTQIIDAVSAIHSVAASSDDNERVYTISGQKLTPTTRLPRGIYIRGGKKYMVKTVSI